MFDQIFEKSDFSNEDLLNIFEETINEKIDLGLRKEFPKNYDLFNSYQTIIFSKKDISRVLSKKYEFVYLQTTGSSYNQWILYHTKDHNIVFIIRSPGLIWNWSWRNLTYQEFIEINKVNNFSKL